jgi:hypothetical protein
MREDSRGMFVEAERRRLYFVETGPGYEISCSRACIQTLIYIVEIHTLSIDSNDYFMALSLPRVSHSMDG